MEVSALVWDLLLGFSSCFPGLVKAMALLSWAADLVFCSLRAQTLLCLSSPLCLAIRPHTRSSLAFLMARANCSRWSGNKHGSSSWDLLGLDLPQDWLSPRREHYSPCPYIRTGDLPTSLRPVRHQQMSDFQPLVWTCPGGMPSCRQQLSPTRCPPPLSKALARGVWSQGLP